MKIRLGKVQQDFYHAMLEHKKWHNNGHGCGWLWDTPSHTKRLADSLVKKGLLAVDANGVYTVRQIGG